MPINNLEYRQKALKEVFDKIETFFPFKSKQELKKFDKRYKSYYKNLAKLPENDKYFFQHIESLMSFLKNSHTKLGYYPLKKRITKKHEEKIIEFKILNENIGYLKIQSWSNRYKKSLIKKLSKIITTLSKNKIKSLIIDVSGNSGGDSSIAQYLSSHFFNKKTLFSITKTRIPGMKLEFKKSYSYVTPQKPYLDLPIILLIDNICFSSNEYFIAGMKDNKRALLIGEPTGGGSGNPKKLAIPYKDSSFDIFVSTWIYYRANKKLLEGRGIKPHILIKKKESSLKRAIKEIKIL